MITNSKRKLKPNHVNQNKPKHVFASCFYVLFVFLGWLDCWLVIGCLPKAWGLWDVMLFDLDLLKPNHGNVMACSMMCVDYWLLLLSNLLVWSWGVLNDLFLMMSCCDMFDLAILESLISIILGYFSVAHWEPMDILIYHLMPFNCLLRTIVIIMIIFWCFPVSRGELMWILWIIFWFFPVACIGMRCFYMILWFVISWAWPN